MQITPPARTERASSMDDSRSTLATSATRLDDVKLYVAGCMLLRHVARGEREEAMKICADDPRLVNYRDYDRRTALHLAASEGRLGIVEDLLNAGARPNRSDRWSGSPLDDALRHRHHAVAAELRKRGARLGAGVDYGLQLIAAAAAGDGRAVADLLDDGAVHANAQDYDGRRPLHLAAGEERLEVVELLLSRGGDVGARDRWGHTPLDGCGHDTPCERALVKAGAPPRRLELEEVRSGEQTPRRAAGVDAGCEFIDSADVELLERLGGGSFGVVYRATWRGTPVAAKCLRVDGGSSEDEALALKDFHNEASVLFCLRHPNIATLLAYSDAPGKEILVSELMRGSVLDRLRVLGEGSRLQKPKALRWATELCRGMAYLHSRKPPMLHRDLKPGNLLLDANEAIKITDFGLATIRTHTTETKSPGPDLPEDLTGTTGSFRFMAPEVASSKPYGRPVDVFSFAMILYNLYASEPPWRGESGEGAARHNIRGERPRVPRNWDAKVQELLHDCWKEEAGARPSFRAILESLGALAAAGLVEADGVSAMARPCCGIS